MVDSTVIELQPQIGDTNAVQIPIQYESKHDKSQRNKKSMKSMENVQVQKQEQLMNKQIVYSTKRGYSVLLLITILLLCVLTLYVIQTGSLEYYLLNGVTGSCISLLLMIPTFVLYRFIEKKVLSQHHTINNKIIETFSLKQQIEGQTQQILQHKINIEKCNLIIAEQEQQINKLSSIKKTDSTSSFHLIQGFRRGEMQIQIECADIHELVSFLNVVTACITLLPFGQTNYRKRLSTIFENKIHNNKYLQMHFYFFLLSYLECADVKRLFRRHRIMKKVKSVADYYNYEDKHDQDMNDAATVFSDDGTVVSAPFTPYSPESEDDNDNEIAMGNFPNSNALFGLSNDRITDDHNKVIYFESKDPIKLFRAPIDNKAEPGLTIVVPNDLQNRFFDPLNGNKFLQQLVVRAIFHSNAKPYLIDCYVKDKAKTTHNNEMEIKYDDDDDVLHRPQQYEGMILSSSFILKKGDDLRKDHSILQMMKFMNEIWRENELKYKDGDDFVECLIYKTIPMGNDVGIIEMIGDCIELESVLSLKHEFLVNITARDLYIARSKYNRLITTAAAAYIASFVCGVRDRHHDNVLIETKSCSLFHIDFGYIFNDTTTLDTAKFAITSDLKKLFDCYKNGWEDFIDITTKAWMILRQNSVELIDFARVAFAFLYKSNDIEQFMRESLKLELNQEEAVRYISNQISKAPTKWKTKMKNMTHTFAQKIKYKTKKKSSAKRTGLKAPQSRNSNTASDDFSARSRSPKQEKQKFFRSNTEKQIRSKSPKYGKRSNAPHYAESAHYMD